MKKTPMDLTGKFNELHAVVILTMCLTVGSLTATTQDLATPTNFHAVQVGYTLELHWTDNADNETKYVLQKEWTYEGYEYSEPIDLPANSEMYVDVNLVPNLEYQYFLSAENDIGSSTQTNLFAVVYVEAPPTPTNVSAAPGPLMSLAISFTDNSDMETFYEIHHTNVPDDYYGRKNINGGELNSTITAYISEAPYNPYSQPPPEYVWYSPNTLVYIKVRAVINDNGTMIYGPFSPVITTMSNPEPATPTEFIATAEGHDVHLTWTDNAFNEAAYFLAKFEGESYDPTQFDLIKLPVNATGYTDVNIPSNIRYNYWLLAVNDFEFTTRPHEYWPGLFRDPHVAKTSMMILETPTVPLNVTATATSPTNILVTFVDDSDVEVLYEILVTSVNDPFVLEVWSPSIGSVVETDVENLTPGVTYFFQVRGLMELNNMVIFGPYSEVISASTPSLTPDPPVAEPATSVTAKSFIANWSAVSGAMYYELDVFDNKDGAYVHGYEGKIVYENSATVVFKKKSAHHYSYLVRAVNEYSESGNSNIIPVGKTKNASFVQGETFDEGEFSGLSIHQYPNPVVNKFQVFISSHEQPIAELQIINHQGSRILTQSILTNELVELDATAYPAGMYILRAMVGRSARMVKVVKIE